MILSAHQPVYLPWAGLLHKIALADLFCYFDIAQYQTKDYNNRNKIKTNTGAIWLSVPVASKNHFDKSVGAIELIADGWQRKHFKSIALAYQKSAYFKAHIGGLEDILVHQTFMTLGDLNLAILRWLLAALAIRTPIVRASDYLFAGSKSDLVLDMCRQLGADVYIFGAQGRDYADVASFSAAGIQPVFQDYCPPVYRQLHGDFLPCLSVIDLLFNEGPRSRAILLAGNASRDDLLRRRAATQIQPILEPTA